MLFADTERLIESDRLQPTSMIAVSARPGSDKGMLVIGSEPDTNAT